GVSLAAQRDVLARLGAAPEERFSRIRTYVASVPASSRPGIIRALNRDPRVRYAERNVRFRADQLPDDPSLTQLWALDNSGQAVQGVPGTPDADIEIRRAHV